MNLAFNKSLFISSRDNFSCRLNLNIFVWCWLYFVFLLCLEARCLSLFIKKLQLVLKAIKRKSRRQWTCICIFLLMFSTISLIRCSQTPKIFHGVAKCVVLLITRIAESRWKIMALFRPHVACFRKLSFFLNLVTPSATRKKINELKIFN